MFTTTGSAGHLGPLLPFADAVRRAGGDVLIATRGSSAEQARATGYDVWPFADSPAEQRSALLASLRALPNLEANARMLTDVFGGIDASAAIPGLLEACATWRPDVMVSEPSEFAGRVISGHLHLPAVSVAITQYAIEHQLRDMTDRVLRRLRAAHGLAAPNGAGSASFTLLPPLLEDPAAPEPPNVRRFREPDGVPAPLPDWWDGATGPLVYVTFGSVAPQQDAVFPALYRAAVDAVAPLDVRVLVTVGRDRDPAALGPPPANVHVERWVPQGDVLPHAAAMVCHGGSGTVRGALAAGVPLVILPLFADQPNNAARVHALGAGIALDDGPGGLAAAVRAVITQPSYAERAAAVAADIRSLPPVEAAAGALRALVT
jgi:UDP:flavonoid glycosyltransferase YjiC (YdhE family)